MRAAVYARFSSELQRDTSLDDQIAACRRYAATKGWTIDESAIFTDAALTGASLDRPGVQALRAVAAAPGRPWDVLLLDDSSRLSRDQADAVRFLQECQFVGVRVVFISQGIDSADDTAETLVGVHGIIDSLYLKELGKKVRRGLSGQIQRGFATGGLTYGYRTVAILDPSGRRDPHGHPARLGARAEVEPDEARVVVRIFELFTSGYGPTRIVDVLNADHVPGPRGQTWKRNAVRRVLLNERYTGRSIWGQRRFERKPGTRQKVARPVPRDQWHLVERPELRIISADVWTQAAARWQEIADTLRLKSTPHAMMRGRNAVLFSRHLFSGFMVCGLCGGSVYVTGTGKGSPRYGCGRSHVDGLSACRNRVDVRTAVADAHLLTRLRAELLEPGVLDYITNGLTAALTRAVDERPTQRADLEARRDQAQAQLENLLTLVEDGRISGPSVANRIAQREADIASLSAALTDVARQQPLRDRLAVIPTWVRAHVQDLAGVLSEAPERTKQEFRRMGLRVTMQPIYDEQPRPFYRATVQASLDALAGTYDLLGAHAVSHTVRSTARAAAGKSSWRATSIGAARGARRRSAR